MPLDQLLNEEDLRRRFSQDTPGHSESDYANFLHLLLSMLSYDPNLRISPREALEHPFFTLL